MKNDSKITKFGKFLRKTSLDELPQIWDIFCSRISVIGHSSLIMSEVLQYNEYQLHCLDVKGGLLCLWQIQPNRHNISFDEMFYLNIEHIQKRSIWLDIKIFLKEHGWLCLIIQGSRMNKILFLDNDLDEFGDYFREKRNQTKFVDSRKIFIKKCKFLRKVFVFLGLKVASFFMYFSYGKWKFEINNYDYFVIPSRRSSKFALWLLRNRKVCVYYWNLITDREISPAFIKDKYPNFMLCSFDPEDSKKYNIRFIDTYYFNNNDFTNKILSDLFYVGGVRPGRKELLEDIKKITNYKYRYNFNLIEFNDFQPGIPYSEIVNFIKETKVIIDLNRDGQNGLTLRPLEAIFYKKKLITNNKNIINFPFYKKNNIFIIGVDSNDYLRDFIDLPFEEIDQKIIEYYEFSSWIRRIIDLWT